MSEVKTFSAKRFDTVGALAAYCKENPCSAHSVSGDTRRFAASGDLSRVSASDAFLSRLEAASLEAVTRHELVSSVSGGFPDVPAYLAGVPHNMRRRVPRAAPAPITIVADIATSWSTSADIIERRGAATLALLRRLEMTGHAVEIYAGYAARHAGNKKNEGRVVICTRIESAPLDLARAAWMLGSPEMQRELCFTAGRAIAGGEYSGLIDWPYEHKRWCRPETDDLHRETFRQAIGGGPEQRLIVIPPASAYTSEFFGSDDKALAWIERAYSSAVALVSETVPG
jgi:hypothetical protein